MGKVVKAVAKALPMAVIAGVMVASGPGGFTFWQGFGAVLAAGTASSLLMKPPKVNRQEHGTNLRLKVDPAAPRQLIYGTAVTGGNLLFRDTTGVENRNLHMIIALAGHEVEAIEHMYWADDKITFSGGQVSGNLTGNLFVYPQLGADNQSAASVLMSESALWTSSHKLGGIAYVHLKLVYDEDKYQNGIQMMRFQVKGRKVYDPRLDDTMGGTGSHRLNTPSTWEWSDNPVLIALDYLRGIKINGKLAAGVGIKDTRIDWANVMAEANICDELVTNKDGSQEKRYTANGMINPTRRHADNLNQMASAMAGAIAFQGGLWRFYAGAYRVPVKSRHTDDVIGAINLKAQKGWSEKMNGVRGVYADKYAKFELKDYPPLLLSDKVATDGGQELWMQLDLPMTTSSTMAQRLSKIYLMRERMEKRAGLSFQPLALEDQCMDNICLTHDRFGFQDKVMRVEEWSLGFEKDKAGNIGLLINEGLVEDSAEIYGWVEQEEEQDDPLGETLNSQYTTTYKMTANQIDETTTKKWAAETGATIGAVTGSNLFRADGSSILLEGEVITAEGTSLDTYYVGAVSSGVVRDNAYLGSQADADLTANAHFDRLGGVITGFSGEGALARFNQANWASHIIGAGKPEDYATLGARIGTNIKRQDGVTIVGEPDIITAQGTAYDSLYTGGISSTDVKDQAWAGARLLQNDTGYVLHPSSLYGVNMAGYGANIGGTSLETVTANAQIADDLTKSNAVKIDASSLPDGMGLAGTEAQVHSIRTIEYQAYTQPPTWDTSFYVLQSNFWYGHTSADQLKIGVEGNSVWVPGALQIDGGVEFNGSVYANSYIQANAQLFLGGYNYLIQGGELTTLRSTYDATIGGFRFQNQAGEAQGYLYHESAGFGLLSRYGVWAVKINGSTNGVDLLHNGSTKLQTYAGGVQVQGHVVAAGEGWFAGAYPFSNAAHDLGSSSYKWRDIWGGIFKTANGSVSWPGNLSDGGTYQYGHAVYGCVTAGAGSSYDHLLVNRVGNTIYSVSPNSQNIVFWGYATATDFTATSDVTVKWDVQSKNPYESLERIGRYRPVTHRWLNAKGPEGIYNGLIAQEVETVDPSLVYTAEDGTKSVNYQKIIPDLIGAVQALTQENARIRSELAELRAKL